MSQGPPGMRRAVRAACCACILIVTGCTLLEGDPPGREGRVPIAVLGDSDSHGYRDGVSGIRRGGDFHDDTFQWTELLTKLRPDDVDMGPAVPWGQRGAFARLRDRLGVPARTPRKSDFLFNFALSGARCSSLASDWPWQSRWAVARIRSDPERWAGGLVVIKIGVNDVGQLGHLARYASEGETVEARASIERCAHEVRETLEAIRGVSSVPVMVVGVADDTSWPEGVVPDWTPDEVARIRIVLDRFDEQLRLVAGDFEAVAFMDDRSWYYDAWPDRDEQGRARTGGVTLGGAVPVTNTSGDRPTNLALADRHAGTVANGYWARSLVRAANDAFGLGIAPPLASEIADLADPDGEFGVAPTGPLPDGSPTLVARFTELSLDPSDLPYDLGTIEAFDANGAPVGETAVGFLVRPGGPPLWLLGDGERIRIDPRRHRPGSYAMVLRVRDRSGHIAESTIPVMVRPPS